MVLEKREMLYEMKRIEQAHPGSIMPPEGLGRGRKWTVLVEAHENCETEYDWTIKAEINFVHPEFIRVLCRLDDCGGAFHFLEAKYFSGKALERIDNKFDKADKVVMRTKTWTMPDGTRHKFPIAFVGPFGSQFVMILANNVRQFRVLMHVMLKVNFYLELKRLLRKVVQRREILACRP